MTRSLVCALTLCCTVAIARAQPVMTQHVSSDDPLAIATFDPEDAVAPISAVQGPGLKVGEGTVIHPTFGAETGFVSNVFYEANDPSPAGILRLMAQFGAASLSQQRLNPDLGGLGDDTEVEPNPGMLEYNASVRAAYDFFLSGNDVVTKQGGLALGATLKGLVNPLGTVSFGFAEDYVRLIRAANFETNVDANRDVNNLGLNLLIHPAGRSLSGYVFYQNTIDVFENSELGYPNRIDHRFGIHPMWRWLPQTQLYIDASIGFVGGLGSNSASSRKVDSIPLIAKAGIATLLSIKTTLRVEGGYTNGFYSSGPSFSAPVASAILGYRYSPLGRIALAYDYIHVDSINANYYRDHAIRFILQQGFDPFIVVLQPELRFREYTGTNVMSTAGSNVRDDLIFAVTGGIHYNFRNTFAAVVDYHFTTVQTDFRYMDNTGRVADPSFVRHELLAGVRLAL